MNILDCVTYFDEDTILDLRFNILYEHVTKFIITEGEYDHRGNKRKLNFDINKYSKFADKIIYLPVSDFKDFPFHKFFLSTKTVPLVDLVYDLKNFNAIKLNSGSQVDTLPFF